MTHPTIHSLAALAALAFMIPSAPAAESADNAAPAAADASAPAPEKRSAPAKIKYTLPSGSLGAASVRQSGGTRGGGNDKMPSLFVLAPDHVALTSQAQPSLFWFQSHPAKAAFQLTLVEPKKAKPALSVRLDSAEQAGIRAVSLAKQGVTLAPGVAYQWNVSLIPDAANRSKDVVASGMIKRVEAPADLEEKTSTASAADRAALYAQAGFWYDALQSLSAAIASDPKNSNLHNLRASLLDQAGLREAAAAERK